MPVRPPSGQIDGQNRMTQSPMATQGYNPQMMPPPNNMGFMLNSAKMPSHYPYNAQYPQGNFSRQQTGMTAMSGPGSMSGHMPNYHSSQPGMYTNGPSQMQVYANMPPSMNRNMSHGGYGPGPYQSNNANMMSNQYSGYSSHMGTMPGQPPPHSMQQGSPMPPGSSASPMVPGSTSAQMSPAMGAQQGVMMPQQHGGPPMNKAAQAAQAALMAAANSVNPRMPHSRGSMSPSRGMFGQGSGGGGVGPLAQMNNMSNSPNLGSPSLNSMSNAVEQLTRSSAATPSSMGGGGIPSSMPGSIPSPGPKTTAGMAPHGMPPMMESNGPVPSHSSPLSNTDMHDSLSRPNSTTTVHPSDLPTDTTSSESSSGMPSDSTSVDSGFHSSDQGEKLSDSICTQNQAGHSPPLGLQQNGEAAGRTVENISPPSSSSSSRQISDTKMPYMNEGGYPLPPTTIPSIMAPMPSSDHCVTTTATLGHVTPSVTQSIASPVTSVSSSSAPPHLMHSMGGSHMMGHHGMGPGGHMMPNGMMGPGGHMGGPPSQMPPNMGGPPGMMPPNMGGPNMNMNQNGPMMGPGGPIMGPNGPMMPPGSMGNNMHHMGQMPPQQQQPPPSQQSPMPNNHPEEVPEKKKKVKKSASDISKLFEMGPEPDRRPFLERVLAFLEESGQPVTSMPAISKTPLDLYKLYFCVREKGGFEEVTRGKKWREICTVVNIGTSASAAFTLKKNYIRYLLNYECKFDRGGINPAPILAQMEAQLAHKREQKSKRAPSPGSTNSNDAFRPPSTSSSQIDGPYPPAGMPPPYMQNPDGTMPNMMMGHGGNIMGHGNMPSNMMGPSPGMMVGPGPGPNMMPPGQQSGMPAGESGGNMMGGPPPPPMMGGGSHAPGYSSPMVPPPHQQPQNSAGHAGAAALPPQAPSGNNSSASPMPPQSGVGGTSGPPITSDSISVQDPFADEPNYQRGGAQPSSGGPPLPMSSGAYPAPQQSGGGVTGGTSAASRPTGSHTADHMITATSRPSDAQTPSNSGGQFAVGQQFDHPDRFDQSSPSLSMRQPAPNSGITPPAAQPPQGDASTMYPQSRFPGPPQQMVGMRPPQPDGSPGQYPYQGQVPSYPNSQYQGYSGVPPGVYLGQRPLSSTPGGMYGTPNRRFPDGASHVQDGSREAQWSPLQRPRMPQGGPGGYMPPGPPSTPPMGTYNRQVGHRGSPQTRGEGGRFISSQKMAKSSYASLTPAPLSKKELVFPADCVEGVTFAVTKRRKLTHKDLAPFEAWRLMLSLKSGQLAESTWALDTLNILLFDDTTHSYFSLATLPGLLEVLTEHLRHCLMQMFSNFHDLEEGQLRQPRRAINGKLRVKLSAASSGSSLEDADVEGSAGKDLMSCLNDQSKRELVDDDGDDDEIGAPFRLKGPNFTMVSRKGLPVKIDPSPSDCSVLELKEWDIYTQFETKKEHWLSGCGDITNHILTHFESDSTNQFLSGKFSRKRTRLEAEIRGGCGMVESESEKKKSNVNESNIVENDFTGANNIKLRSFYSGNSQEKNNEVVCVESIPAKDDFLNNKVKTESSDSHISHSRLCNGEKEITSSLSSTADFVVVKQEPMEEDPSQDENVEDGEVKKEQPDVESKSVEGVKEEAAKEGVEGREKKTDISQNEKDNDKSKSDKKEEVVSSKSDQPLENGELEEPKLSPMINHRESDGKFCNGLNDDKVFSNEDKGKEDEDSSPPVLKAECEDIDDSCQPTLPIDDTPESGKVERMDTVILNLEASQKEPPKEDGTEIPSESVEDKNVKEAQSASNKDDSALDVFGKETDDGLLNESCVSETEEMSASFVTDLLKEDENTEDEAFQRDDPPLCVTQESRDELGRRCVCISNIIRSLSCVPGNEAVICQHPGIMRILGRLLLLHHSHPVRPSPRKLPRGDEEEREEPPRVYDDEHWWWDYLDQLRENVLVILANICSHLMLDNFSEQLCFPLLEGLLHWVICPASVARDPLPTLTPGSVLSPQRLVLEALCKLCIHETNVDLLLATPPMKRLLELFGVLVRLLADRNTQITREFSIVLLSLLVQGETSVARAVALQHPCVSLLVDFLETAEQNALAIANQQGLNVLQNNPEAMGTSLDMLRRAASILLHMSRVPDNRKMFIPQQSRLLNLVMSQILDQSVACTLSEVLFECSQLL